MFQSRDVDRTKRDKVKDANYYFFVEACVALFVSFVINVFVVAVFAHGLFNKTNKDVVSIAKFDVYTFCLMEHLLIIAYFQHDVCVANGNEHANIFSVVFFNVHYDIFLYCIII